MAGNERPRRVSGPSSPDAQASYARRTVSASCSSDRRSVTRGLAGSVVSMLLGTSTSCVVTIVS